MTTERQVSIMNAVSILRALRSDRVMRRKLNDLADRITRFASEDSTVGIFKCRQEIRKMQDALVTAGTLKDLLLRDALFGVNRLLLP